MKVKIYKIEDAENFKAYEKYLALVSPERQKRAAKLRGAVKTTTVLSEYFLKRELKAALGRDEGIKRTLRGKPYIKSGELFFSVSHSGNFIALAIGRAPVGVDIERVRNVNLRIAERFFAEEEKKAVFSAENREAEFLKIHTAKEAYVKLVGTGITDGFSAFSVFDADIKGLIKTEAFSDFVMSVASEDKNVNIERKTVFPNVN